MILFVFSVTCSTASTSIFMENEGSMDCEVRKMKEVDSGVSWLNWWAPWFVISDTVQLETSLWCWYQRSILSLCFVIFVRDLGDGAEHIPSKTADDKNLGGMSDTPDGCAAMQKNRNRLKKWVTGISRCSRKKCQVLPLGRSNPMYQAKLGPTNWKLAWHKKLWQAPGWPWATTVLLQRRKPTASWTALGRALLAGQVRWPFPSTLPWLDSSGVLGPDLDFPVRERCGHAAVGPAKHHKGD